MKPYTKILVPTDFAASANEALETAVDLAARYGASITLVHVFEPLDRGRSQGRDDDPAPGPPVPLHIKEEGI